MSGGIHCPQCRLYITSEFAELCPRCGLPLDEIREQGSGSFAPMTYAPAPWPAAPTYETPYAPNQAYGTPYAPNQAYETPYAPNQAYWPDEGAQYPTWQPAPQKRRDGGNGLMLKGCLLALAGIALTAGSYALTSPGGHFFLFYGLIVSGGIMCLRGWIKGDD